MNEIEDRARAVFAQNDALVLASSGGEYSPWVLGVYFASEGLHLYALLETSGKTYRNVTANARVSFLVSKNDAQLDFVQGIGALAILPEEEAPAVRALLEKKMPWYQTYTPVVPVRLDPDEIFVSSLSSGWFPARKLKVGETS